MIVSPNFVRRGRTPSGRRFSFLDALPIENKKRTAILSSMTLTKTRAGELFVLTEAFLWSLFPVITILTFSAMGPLFSAGISTILSSFFFAGLLTLRGTWSQLRRKTAWKDVLLASLLIGVVLYGLFFVGLRATTAGNASIMALMEVFFSFLILGIIVGHEALDGRHLVGALCMVGGALLILLPKSFGWHSGDLLIVLAIAFGPIGNLHAQRARKIVSAECIMFVRSTISGCSLLLLALLLEPWPSVAGISSSIEFLLINGFVMMGFEKILWQEAIHRIPITKAISLASIAPLFTLVFARLFLHERIMAYQIAAFVPIFVGVVLLTKSRNREL
ncbi:DMT family transporter [Candidatus Peregrinibacteria bacterium]|nr:DMT family transporter [Candidatus Peregrinibacteria bacterium]